MRAIIFSILLMGCLYSWAQVPLPLNDEGNIEFNGTVMLEGLSQEVILERADEWFQRDFKGNFIHIRSKDESSIVGRMQYIIEPSESKIGSTEIISFEIRVEVEMKGYRYYVFDYIHKASSSSLLYITAKDDCMDGMHSWRKERCTEVKQEIERITAEVVDDLQGYMASPETAEKTQYQKLMEIMKMLEEKDSTQED